MVALADLDFTSDLPVLGYRRLHCGRRRLERQYRCGTRHLGKTTLKADGLGAYIAEVTQKGDTPMIISSIAVMCLFVVITNKLVWRRLYEYAEKRFHLD